MRTDDRIALRLVLAALTTIVAAQVLAGCSDDRPFPRLGVSLPSVRLPSLAAYAPPEPPEPTQVERRVDPRVGWCEPLEPAMCSETSECGDGFRCMTSWRDPGVKACRLAHPGKREREWRAERLRVVVDHVCERQDGCDPQALHAYLRVLALRESTWRPAARHRLDPDIEANAAAWERYRHRYASNPARDPERWSTGLGLYGQIPALWLARWDVEAPPETLCGEVEATEVHLRAARDQVRKVRHGVDCAPVTRVVRRIGNRDVALIKVGDGEPDYWGSACEEGSGTCAPSWYDVSRVNSGSLCPGDREHREAFERRAESLGLDPWAPVTVAMLGRGIPVEQQDAVAESLRQRMDAIPRP